MKNRLSISWFTVFVVIAGMALRAQGVGGQFFAGQDLHLSGSKMTVHKVEDGVQTHILVFDDGFSMSIGDNQLSSNMAVVWLETVSSEFRGQVSIDYNCQVYLERAVSIAQGQRGRTSGLDEFAVERGEAMVARFLVSGEVYATANTQNEASVANLDSSELYKNAVAAVTPLRVGPKIAAEAVVPEYEQIVAKSESDVKRRWQGSDIFDRRGAVISDEKEKEPVSKDPQYEYPVNIAGLFKPAPKIENQALADGSYIATITGRFYLWQKRNEDGDMVEFQADNAVIFHGGDFTANEGSTGQGAMASGSVQAVYLKGNIVMTELSRTIRADEIYYDFKERNGLAVASEMRNFDTKRGLPIYLRAKNLRIISENSFDAEAITLTTSEFYMPQVSMTASRMILTDTTGVEAREGKEVDKGSYDGVLYDVKMKLGKATVFKWPRIRTNFERPDIPIKKLRIGSDSEYGTAVESQWHLSRLLGRKEPDGVDSTLALDYYSDRGVGAGAHIDYEMEDYFGDIVGYVMSDRGEDDLGRTSDRKNLKPDADIRGRFTYRHKHYLPYDWQATVEMSYLSDKNFLEEFYRNEFYTGKEKETLLFLKRLKDNWSFSLLNKVRINDFETQTEELPTLEFHIKGLSFWNDSLTYYGDNRISRLRPRFDEASESATDEEQFGTFAYSRHEVDMPFTWGTFKMVPFVAGTYGMDDNVGFTRKLDGDTSTRETDNWLSEAGIRVSTMYWKEDQYVRSRLWDLNGMRHIIKPHFEAIAYHAGEDVFEMRDMINVGVSQRWQTRRGPKENLRSLDWMRLDVDATWVSDDEDNSIGASNTYGPAKFIWNDPAIPVFNRRDDINYGMVRDSVNADYIWRLSDTTTILGDANYDIQSGVLQQLNAGVVRYVYPDLSYYVGSRYLRPVLVNVPAPDNISEKGSHSFVTALTYVLNPRYTATFSQEYNFDYGQNVRTELTILRHYHRMYYGLTMSVDESRDRNSIVFNVWPEGVKELALGSRKYVGLTGMTTED